MALKKLVAVADFPFSPDGIAIVRLKAGETFYAREEVVKGLTVPSPGEEPLAKMAEGEDLSDLEKAQAEASESRKELEQVKAQLATAMAERDRAAASLDFQTSARRELQDQFAAEKVQAGGDPHLAQQAALQATPGIVTVHSGAGESQLRASDPDVFAMAPGLRVKGPDDARQLENVGAVSAVEGAVGGKEPEAKLDTQETLEDTSEEEPKTKAKGKR